MNHLKIGDIFDLELLKTIKELNVTTSYAHVDELYGSMNEYSYLVARPLYRLPDVKRTFFERYIQEALNIGLTFNYTLNSNYIGSGKEIIDRSRDIKRFIRYLCDIGITVFTVSLPIVANFIREISQTVGIEISTISHIDSISQIKQWKDQYQITKICGNLMKNREIKFLMRASDYCRKNNIILTLMVNEFCVNGVMEPPYSASHCIYRDHCYSLHSTDYSFKEAAILNGYPRTYCRKYITSPILMLKSYFIRPEDMHYYNSIGINHFKITGRTGTLEYMNKLLYAYMNQRWEGNLIELYLDTTKQSDDVPLCDVDNTRLGGFLEYWFCNTDHVCACEICGETCTYCNDFYEQNINVDN